MTNVNKDRIQAPLPVCGATLRWPRAGDQQETVRSRQVGSVGTALGALGVTLRTIAAGDLAAGVRGKPRREVVSRKVGQQVHDRVALEIDEHGDLGMAAPPRPIFDAEHARRRERRQGRRRRAAGAGGGARGEAQCRQEARAGLRADQRAHPRQQPRDRPRVGRGDGRKALARACAWALGFVQWKRRTASCRRTDVPCALRSASVRV